MLRYVSAANIVAAAEERVFLDADANLASLHLVRGLPVGVQLRRRGAGLEEGGRNFRRLGEVKRVVAGLKLREIRVAVAVVVVVVVVVVAVDAVVAVVAVAMVAVMGPEAQHGVV